MDIIGGKCVRLTQGDFSRETVYSNDPLETAKRFEAAGLKRLHMVDLDGARSGSPSNLQVLAHVAGGTTLTIDYGGGIKSETDAAAVFNSGGLLSLRSAGVALSAAISRRRLRGFTVSAERSRFASAFVC